MIDISIVVINYKTRELTLDCVNSVFKNTKDINYEVILVDNASLDGSVETFKNYQSTLNIPNNGKLKLVFNNKNTGFTGGNNTGLAHCRGRYVLFLNSDTLLIDNTIKSTLDKLEANSDIGAISCQLQNMDGTLQGCGGSFPTLFKVFAWMFFVDDILILKNFIKPYHAPLNMFNDSHFQDWIAGTYFLTRHDLLDIVKGWDNDYFMYVEDVDLCYRIKKAGYKIYYLAEKYIKHVGSASSTTDMSIYRELMNIKLFYKKNMPAWQWPLVSFFIKIGSLARLLIFRKEIYAKVFREV